ncbi:seed maturation protein PM35, partial [Trifolium medium]|nr:seed maturation protein PM35 [Trifolium medium]
KEGRGAGSTEAPTLSGANVASEAEFNATNVINSKGVP